MMKQILLLLTFCTLGSFGVVAQVVPPSNPTCSGTDKFVYNANVTLAPSGWVSTGGPYMSLWSGRTRRVIPTSSYPAAFSSEVYIEVTEAISWDGYPSRHNTAAQLEEQWKLVFYKNGSVVNSTPYTGDITDSVRSAEWKGALGTEMHFPYGVDSIVVVHIGDPTSGNSTSGANAGSVYPSSVCFKYRTQTIISDLCGIKNICVDHTKVAGSSSLANFPMYVDITSADLKSKSNGGFVESASGNDIVFTTTNNAVLGFEIMDYNPSTGALKAWVKVPSVSSSSNTCIELHFGDNTISASYASPSAWSGDYRAVYHFDDYRDATYNGNNGTNSGSSLSTGKIGGAIDLDGANDYVTVPYDASIDFSGKKLTISTWINVPDQSVDAAIVVRGSAMNTEFYMLGFDNFAPDLINTRIGTNTGPNRNDEGSITNNTWQYLTFVYDGDLSSNQKKTYLNGVLLADQNASGNINTGNYDLLIGKRLASARYLDGKIDELRLTSSAHSAGWVSTEYNNQNSPSTFYTVTDQKSCCDPLTNGGAITGNQTVGGAYNPSNISNATLPTGGTGTIVYDWVKRTKPCNGSYGSWTVIVGATSATYNPPTITETTQYARRARRLGCVPYSWSNIIAKTVVENYTTPGVVSGDQIACGGYNPTTITSTSVPSGGCEGSLQYLWQQRTLACGGAWSAYSSVPGGNTATYDPPAITETTQYRRLARRNPFGGWVYSNVITKTVVENFNSAGTISGDQTVGGSYDPTIITSSVDPSGGCNGTVIYLWQTRTKNCATGSYSSWSNISSSNSLTYDPGTITQTTQYRRLARRSPCGWVYSAPITKTVVENFNSPGAIAGDETQCGGFDPALITSTSTPSGGCEGTIEFLWRMRTRNCDGSWNAYSTISGATSATYDPSAITQTTQYRRQARRNPFSGWVYATPVIKEVVENFTSAGTISGDQISNTSFNPTNIVGTSPIGGCGGTIQYQWQTRVAGGTWSNISGATGANYNPPITSVSAEYRRAARRSPCAWIYSDTTQIIVNNVITGKVFYDKDRNQTTGSNAGEPNVMVYLIEGGDPTAIDNEVNATDSLRVISKSELASFWRFRVRNYGTTAAMWKVTIENANYTINPSEISNNSLFNYSQTMNTDSTYDLTFEGKNPLAAGTYTPIMLRIATWFPYALSSDGFQVKGTPVLSTSFMSQVIKDTTTASNGTYRFEVPYWGGGDSFYLATDKPSYDSEVEMTTGNLQSAIFSSGGNLDANNDYGFNGKNSITGYVFRDENADSIKNPGETGKANVDVYLYDDINHNGVVDASESTAIATARTSAMGRYTFNDIFYGDSLSYIITSDLGDYPSNTAPTTDNIEDATFTTFNNKDQENNFGFVEPNIISGTVFADYDEDEVNDADEPGSDNITVNLYHDANNNGVVDAGEQTPIQSVSTGSTGNYLFDVPYEGGTMSYVVNVDTNTLPTGSFLTTDNVEMAVFTRGGSTDPNNDFGHSECDFITGIAAPTMGCTGEDQVFAVSPPVSGATYAWVFPSGNPGTSSAVTQMVTWPTAGTYEVELAVSDATCTDTISHSIVINTGVTASAAPSATVCRGGEAELDASASTSTGANYTWSVESGDPYSIDGGGNTTSPTVSPFINTVYKLTVTSTSSTCSNVAFVSVDVDVDLNPTALVFGPSGAIHDSSMVYLDGALSTAPITNPTATMNYEWLEDGVAMAAWNYDTMTTQVSGATDYGLITIDPSNGCADTAYASVMPTLPPVPVELIGLKAKLQGSKDVLVTWSTATELNNEKFEVQRRYEYEQDFTTIGEVAGAGNSSSTLSYSYVDRTNQWLSPVVYYRLKQIDYDGASELTYAVPVSKQSDLELMVYPNPAQSETTVAVLGEEEIQRLRVVDMFGKDVSGDVVMLEESGIYTLDVRALRNGTYFIEVITETQKTIERIQVAR